MTKSWSHTVDVAYFAIGARHPDMLALLLARGADATRALSSAVWTDADVLGDIVLAHGADANRATSGDRPLLNDLVRWGQVGAALWLLARGADPQRKDATGHTPIDVARFRGRIRLLAGTGSAGS